MCNELHKDSEPIPESGTGWKIFDNKVNREFRSFMYSEKYIETDGWISWRLKLPPERGFTFFLQKPDFEYIKERFQYGNETLVLKQIEYKNGLGKHMEDRFLFDELHEIALCKDFRIIE